MSLIENIRLAVAGLKVSKMRALLTMLGIIIGIGSVIAIVTLGDSLTGSITGSMASMGANNIMVSLQERESSTSSSMMDNEMDEPVSTAIIADGDKMTAEMIDSLLETFPDDIIAVSLSESVGNGKAQDGRKYANVAVTGASVGYKSVNNLEMLDGRFIIEKDVLGRKNVAVVSDKLLNNLFGDTDPLEQEIKVYTNDQIITYTIVGVYKYVTSDFMSSGSVSDADLRTDIYIPISTAQKLSGAGHNYRNFTIAAAASVNAKDAANRITDFFERYYKADSKYKVTATSMESMLESLTSMLSTVQIAIAAIAAISLLVGGIGVMNIMLVSVTERTREIGTRKALGARSSSVRTQFVVESMIICLIGGAIGVLLGLGLGMAGSNLLGYPATASPTVIAIAVLFSMVIGVFFGYYPASKAAKLDPIESLRYE